MASIYDIGAIAAVSTIAFLTAKRALGCVEFMGPITV
eukprot:CAMPEP_0173120386 /NCGR_PEP_ID=MMETSP1102-20130122/52495_1 /TAXON_ID=49646 /ORGANISM="Geminigera sp., Strain Caron Lab Isolate" /LENGTH=36 /DNA_ID= /DNA_START= /DNA_END= /DNA_ORIENTATION=